MVLFIEKVNASSVISFINSVSLVLLEGVIMLTVSFNITLIITELIKATALVKKDNQIKPTVISMEELGSRIFNPDQGRGSQAG